jgi:hypothetical protein
MYIWVIAIPSKNGKLPKSPYTDGKRKKEGIWS